MTLTKEQILAAGAPQVHEVEVPEWGGTVRLRELTVAEVSSLSGKDDQDEGTVARAVALSVVGEDGKAMFTAAEVSGLAMVRGGLRSLMDHVDRINLLTAKAQEAAAGNSETRPGASSSSA